jgi:hypothetical protein
MTSTLLVNSHEFTAPERSGKNKSENMQLFPQVRRTEPG